MAITYEASGFHEFSTAGANLSFTPDAGTLEDDVFLVSLACRQDQTIQLTGASAPATAFWANVTDTHFVNLDFTSGDRAATVLLWKAPSNAPGPVTVPLTGSATGSVTWQRFRGASGIFEADEQAYGNGVVSSWAVPALAITVADCFVAGGCFLGSSTSATAAFGAGWTKRQESSIVRNMQSTKGVQASAGSSGTVTVTLTGSPVEGEAWQVALLPAGSTPPVETEDVMATGQTAYMPAGYSGDIADTPAIWVDTDDPSRSVILGSRKAASAGGIDAYDLSGARTSFWAAGEVNNVAVRDFKGRGDAWDGRILVIGTNRTNNTLTYGWLDRAARTMTLAGSTAVGFEPYGCCLYVSPVNGDIYAFVSEATGGAGGLKQYRLAISGSTVSGTQVRSMPTASLSEGMACDDATQTFFLTEEDVGFFKYGAEPGAGTSRTEIDLVGGGNLVADVEGITIAYGRGSDPDYVIVSSQGDNTFVAYDLAAPHGFVKKWHVIGDGGLIGETTETDGIAVSTEDFSPFWPDGLFVAHDTANTDVSQAASNFKIVDLARIFPELSHRAADVALPSSSTASLSGPAARWLKSPMDALWFDTVAEEWRAIVPTSTGHRMVRLDETDTAASVMGAVVSADQGARVAAVHNAGTTYVVIAPATGGTNLTVRRYNSAWTQVGSDVSVPVAAGSFDRDAQPVTLYRASNGHLFVAWNAGDRTISIRRSTDDGVTWGGTNNTANLTMAPAWNGVSGPVALGDDGTNLVMLATANDGFGQAARRMALTASPMTTAAWSTETLPTLPSGITSDDHLHLIVLPDGRMLATTKTTGSVADTTPLFLSLVRSTGGTWTSQTLEPGPDEIPPSYSRPRVTATPAGEILAAYSSIYGAGDLTVRRSSVAALGTWVGRESAMLGPGYSDGVVLPSPRDLAASYHLGIPWPVLAHNRDDSKVHVQWQAVPAPDGTIPSTLNGAAVVDQRLGSGYRVVARYWGSTKVWERQGEMSGFGGGGFGDGGFGG